MSFPDLLSLSLRFESGRLSLLDQQQLPDQEEWLEINSPADMIRAIKALKIRGAPAIGVAAALCLYRYSLENPTAAELIQAARDLREARPTAVNLMLAVDRMVLNHAPETLTTEFLARQARVIFEEDVQLCENIAASGVDFFEDGDSILTHCNTGGLATVGIGTALGVIRRVHESGKRIHVYVDETRPLLQGGRLTTYECEKLGIPYTLICDNMAPALMRAGKIQKVIVGSDRIALNGDFANKTGTYGTAIAAHHHGIPFFTAAPWTTIDGAALTGADIPVEERNPEEVRGYAGVLSSVRWSPRDAPVYNPAFDVTPMELVSHHITDAGAFDAGDVEAGRLREIFENGAGVPA